MSVTMAGSVLGYFGFGGSAATQAPPENQAVRALPGNWYTSEEMYQLERRAIFTRRWLILTHKSRLLNPGDFLRYNIANYDIVVSKDQSSEIHAFHNVCRHRAYPVVEKDGGNAKIFSCKYHGWSYGLSGKLAKAPGYQELQNFEKAKNGLFPIHTHIDRNGFIWINMDAKKEPEVSWESQFNHVDEQTRFDQFNFDDYEFDHTWNLEGPLNWKILADNFNECYHCKTAHPDLTAGWLDLESHDVHCSADYIQHYIESPEDHKELGQEICSTYCFPNASFTITKHFLFMQKFMPKSPDETVMYYEVWRNKHSSEEDFLFISDTYKRVMGEDKVLCERAQKNIKAGVFVNGELNPYKEKGPLFFQNRCREIVMEQSMKEKKAGQKIWPAKQQLESTGTSAISKEMEDFCEGLACSNENEKNEFAW
jgi:phenylpropionate dioxygenase-like ring-hydroxylating dioxygenase large terminal subunit